MPEARSASPMSLSPMKARMAARPAARYTSRFSRPPMRKYRCRSPSSANRLAEKTRNGSRVRPKIAGMESTANSTSVTPIAMTRMSSGVA